MKRKMSVFTGVFLLLILNGCSTFEDAVAIYLNTTDTTSTHSEKPIQNSIEEIDEEKYTESEITELEYFIWDTLITKEPYRFFAPFYKNVELKNNAKDLYVSMSSTYNEFSSSLDTSMEYQYRIFSDSKLITPEFWFEQSFANPKNKTDYEKFIALIPPSLFTMTDRFENINFILENPTTKKTQILSINKQKLNEFVLSVSKEGLGVKHDEHSIINEFFIFNEAIHTEYLKRFYRVE